MKKFCRQFVFVCFSFVLFTQQPWLWAQVDDEDYYVSYDDSSEEEDNKKFEYDDFEEVEHGVTVLQRLPALKNFAPKDLALSFLLHEFGIRLLRSPAVTKVYRAFKKVDFEEKRIPGDEVLKECIVSAFKEAFLNIYGEKKKLTDGNNKQINDLADKLLHNKRAFVEAVRREVLAETMDEPEKNLSSFNLKGPKLSSMLHEFEITLLRSPEVSILKNEYLKKGRIPDDEVLKECIVSAFKKAFLQTYGKKKKLTNNNNKQIGVLADKLLHDKRAFVKAVRRKELIKIIGKLEESLSSFDLEGSKIKNVQDLHKIVFDVLVEIGLYDEVDQIENLGEISIRSTEIRKFLQVKAYSNSSPLKKQIVNFFKSTSKRKIKTFVEENESVLLDSESHSALFENFQNALYEELNEQNVSRKTLPIIFGLSYTSKTYHTSNLLAYIKLLTTSNMRLIENFRENKNILGDDNEAVFRFFDFPLSRKKIIEKNSISKLTGARVAYLQLAAIKKSTSYPSLYEIIKNVEKHGFSDENIANWIRLTLQGKGVQVEKNLKDHKFKGRYLSDLEISDLKRFLNALTYLLFGLETARSPASLLAHHMMLDLIEAKRWTWQKAFGQKAYKREIVIKQKLREEEVSAVPPAMPMAMGGAVEVARRQHLYYPTTFPYKYDRYVENLERDRKKRDLQYMVEQEITLFKDWLDLNGAESDFIINGEDSTKELKLVVRINALKILHLLNMACEQSFKIRILSDDDEFKLIALQDYQSIDVTPLIENQVEIKTIIGWLEKNEEEKIETFLNDDVLDYLDYIASPEDSSEEVYTIEFLEQIYDGGKTVDGKYYCGSDGLIQFATNMNKKSEDHRSDNEDESDNTSDTSKSNSSGTSSDSDNVENDSDSEGRRAYYIHSVTYENPLLNDPQIHGLLVLAKHYYGTQGVNEFIALGMNPRKYQAFMNWRQHAGDAQAVQQCVRQALEYRAFLDYAMDNVQNQPQAREQTNFDANASLPIYDPAQEASRLSDGSMDEKLQAQKQYFARTGIAYESLAQQLHLEPGVVTENKQNFVWMGEPMDQADNFDWLADDKHLDDRYAAQTDSALAITLTPEEKTFLQEQGQAYSENAPWYQHLMSGWWSRQALLMLGLRQVMHTQGTRNAI